jgi:hypothetical protein
MNNIHILYQSAISSLQDKPFFFLRRIFKNQRKILDIKNYLEKLKTEFICYFPECKDVKGIQKEF